MTTNGAQEFRDVMARCANAGWYLPDDILAALSEAGFVVVKRELIEEADVSLRTAVNAFENAWAINWDALEATARDLRAAINAGAQP